MRSYNFTIHYITVDKLNYTLRGKNFLANDLTEAKAKAEEGLRKTLAKAGKELFAITKERYTYRDLNMPRWSFVAWVHAGGDDYSIEGTLSCATIDEAKAEVVKILKKRRSHVLNDFMVKAAA